MVINISPNRTIYQKYFEDIKDMKDSGQATEFTYRTPFATFLTDLHNQIKLIEEPHKIPGVGRPDFKALRGASASTGLKIGFIETKDIGKNLDKIVKMEQFQRYLDGVDNIILTDYIRFMLFRKKQILYDIRLFTVQDLNNVNHQIPNNLIDYFKQIFEDFFNYNLEPIKDAEELAIELSKKTKLLKDLALTQLKHDIKAIANNQNITLIHDFYEGLQLLMPNIKKEDCADAFAQTISYGLLMSRINSTNLTFQAITAFRDIPQNFKVIRFLLRTVTDPDIPIIPWIIEDLVALLKKADLVNIFAAIKFNGKKKEDPFTYFYENFLAYYDPDKRKKLGVYYTPREVVFYIIKTVNQILQSEFNKPLGFGEDDVIVLDPAVGTGNFLWRAYTVAIKEIKNAGLQGILANKIKDHILKDFIGFEILITPFIITNIKLMMVLKENNYALKPNDKIQVYLTDTLEDVIGQVRIAFGRAITNEARDANRIKRKKDILVVIGNPPYAKTATEKKTGKKKLTTPKVIDIKKLLEDYKRDLNEKNIQPLSDIYLKFIRFAQLKIEENGEGIIGFIVNNSFLDGVLHRQMRKTLLETFDAIYIINLHGDSNKREKCPDGSPDQNVFDIMQGVTIIFFIKKGNLREQGVFYFDLYGKRKFKNDWLLDDGKSNLNNIQWKTLDPQINYHFFVPFNVNPIYETFYSLKDIFKNYNSGIVTGKDEILTDFYEDDLKRKMEKIFNQEDFSDFEQLRQNTTIKNIKKHMVSLHFEQNRVKRYHYRPFDFRYIYYYYKKGTKIMERDRYNSIAFQLFRENIAIITSRLNASQNFNGIIVTKDLPDYKLGERTRGSYIFPLYDHTSIKSTIEASIPNYTPETNFQADFTNNIKMKYPNNKITPKLIFSYIYGVLHMPTYRAKYLNYLKIDFPRIPFPEDYDKLEQISTIGKELITLHLMKNRLTSSVTFPEAGNNYVDEIVYTDNKVYINDTQYFENISPNIWEFYIGGYRIAKRYLNERVKRTLNSTEIQHYIQVIEIAKKTLEYMEKLENCVFF